MSKHKHTHKIYDMIYTGSQEEPLYHEGILNNDLKNMNLQIIILIKIK